MRCFHVAVFPTLCIFFFEGTTNLNDNVMSRKSSFKIDLGKGWKQNVVKLRKAVLQAHLVKEL